MFYKLFEFIGYIPERRGIFYHFIADPVDLGGRFGDLHLGIDQLAFHGFGAIGINFHHRNFYDAVYSQVGSGSFQVKDGNWSY